MEKSRNVTTMMSVIMQGQKLFSASLSKGEYEVQTREGYKIMAYRSQMGYINAVALPDNRR